MQLWAGKLISTDLKPQLSIRTQSLLRSHSGTLKLLGETFKFKQYDS